MVSASFLGIFSMSSVANQRKSMFEWLVFLLNEINDVTTGYVAEKLA
jgi:hypothetical protein